MYELCGKLKNLTPYEPIKGEYSLRLDANESSRTPPLWLQDKMKSALDTVAFNRYPDPYASELCRAFASYYGVDPDMVTAGNGSDELISVLTSCFLETGDRVLTFHPDFSMYGFYAELYEKENRTVEKDGDLVLTADGILGALRESGARAVLFSNPCNPTGQGMTRQEVRKVLRGTDALVVLDEAYMDFWEESMLPEAGEYDNLIILRTCSKALGMASLRLGFAVANETLTRALRAAKSPYNVSAVDQALGAAVLTEHRYLRACREEIIRQRDRLLEGLNALNDRLALGWRVYPSVANFALIGTEKADEIYRALLEQGIAVRCFPNALRITAPSPTSLPVLLFELEKVLTDLSGTEKA